MTKYRSQSDPSDLPVRVVVYSINKSTRPCYIINLKPIIPCRIGVIKPKRANEVFLSLKTIIIYMKLFYEETFNKIEKKLELK